MSTNPVRASQQKSSARLEIFSTCPSSLLTRERYAERVREIARWSENAGCAGILIYTDNTLADPWAVAQTVIHSTSALSPLVAVQPVYMHPYAAAKMVATLGLLYGRRMYLNMVAGGFKNDLASLDDAVPHDARYTRLVEYTRVIRALLESRAPVTFEGSYYRLRNATFQPHLPTELLPGILVSGSSEAGVAAARDMDAIAVKYPEPPEQCAASSTQEMPAGVRIGIVARRDDDEAWAAALERFPEDRKGQLTRQLATKISDSAWHKQLASISAAANGTRGAYWLHPFENYQTNCPYLVGSYETVAAQIARYIRSGFGTFILDIPASEEEFEHVSRVFQLAGGMSE
jgi:alkanesulfonate monooxygenase